MPPIELRPARDGDLAPLCELINRGCAHDGIQQVLALEELRESVDMPFIDLAEDARVAEVDGQLAGWVWIWNQPSTAREERAFVFGEVEPVHRGRGVGRALFGWGVERATERLAGRDHDLPRYVRADAYDWLEPRHRLYARFGFEPVRWFEELCRPLGDVPDAPLPAGVAIEQWPDDRDEEIRTVRNAAFADHWGNAPRDEAGWHQMVRGHGARADLSFVAVDESSGEVLSLCLNHAFPEDEAVTGRRDGWIDNLATAREWRGRGLASALIAASFQAFEKAGFTHAMIGVDADSPTGAARLYRNLGFEPMHRSITYQLEVPVSSR